MEISCYHFSEKYFLITKVLHVHCRKLTFKKGRNGKEIYIAYYPTSRDCGLRHFLYISFHCFSMHLHRLDKTVHGTLELILFFLGCLSKSLSDPPLPLFVMVSGKSIEWMYCKFISLQGCMQVIVVFLSCRPCCHMHLLGQVLVSLLDGFVGQHGEERKENIFLKRQDFWKDKLILGRKGRLSKNIKPMNSLWTLDKASYGNHQWINS